MLMLKLSSEEESFVRTLTLVCCLPLNFERFTSKCRWDLRP